MGLTVAIPVGLHALSLRCQAVEKATCKAEGVAERLHYANAKLVSVSDTNVEVEQGMQSNGKYILFRVIDMNLRLTIHTSASSVNRVDRVRSLWSRL